jgi:integrase
MLLSAFLEDTYAPLRQLAPKAIYQYRLTLKRFEEFLARPPVVADLTDIQVQRFAQARKLSTSASTGKKDRTHLQALANLAARKRLLPEFLALPPMRAPGRAPRAYTAMEVAKLIREAKALPGLVGSVRRGIWWATLLRTMWETGERIGAHRGLRWGDVDLDACWITFPAEARKGHVRDIRRRISPELAVWLRTFAGSERALVWAWPGSETAIWNTFNRLCKRLGITARGFHGFRKASATYVAMAGGDPTAHLDHSDPRLAKRHYLDESIMPGQSALDFLPPLDLDEPAA